MEKKLSSYETLFAVSGNLTEEEAKAIEEKFTALVKENAEDVAVDEWGKKKLAYAINYVTEAYYTLITFKSEPTFPLELERILGITEGVIRYMTTIKVEKAVKAAPAKAEEAGEDVTAAPAAEEQTAEN